MMESVLRFILICAVLFQTPTAMEYHYMDLWCTQTLNMENDQFNIQLTSDSSYRPNMKCQLNIEANADKQIMLYFKSLDIEQSGTCQYDFLEIDDGSSRDDPYIAGGKLCGQSKPGAVFTTSGRYLTLYFQSDDSAQFSGFEVILTPYHTGHCYSDEYKCDNERCIDDDLSCNDYNPCGDFSDCNLGLTAAAIVGIIAGGIAFTVIVIITIFACRRRTIVVQHSVPVATVTSAYGYSNAVPGQYAAPPPYSRNTGAATYLQNSYQKY